MIDLHTHILPHVDDGAESWEEAVAMCRLAGEDGCSVLVATPHQRHPHWWNDDLATLDDRRRKLQAQLGPYPRIVLGAEVRADIAILDAVDNLESAPSINRMASSRYILLEFGAGAGPDPESVVHEMSIAGWTPVLAHPECIPWLAQDQRRIHNLVKLGALLQITAMSVLGTFGRGPKEASWKLLQSDLVHVMASDCHNLHQRPPGLSAATRLIEKRFGTATAEAITQTNPKAIIDDRIVCVAA